MNPMLKHSQVAKVGLVVVAMALPEKAAPGIGLHRNSQEGNRA